MGRTNGSRFPNSPSSITAIESQDAPLSVEVVPRPGLSLRRSTRKRVPSSSTLLLSLCFMSARQSLLASQSTKPESRYYSSSATSAPPSAPPVPPSSSLSSSSSSLSSSSRPYKVIGTFTSVSFASFLH